MRFTVAGTLLDSCVLGALQGRPAYGYELTQQIQAAIDVSESTLYPVLRRLLQSGKLDTFDEPFDGRNRRYYRITGQGKAALQDAMTAWHSYKESIETLLTGGIEP
ncbi:MAG: PadR family transcriptional regulator [Peptococcaceae bacterium]|jgi:PadR family transcriptional regulator PadR|nr:PadR family transcriptional regulator [Peptococcaceae bacterium]MDR2736366.1 PadR family transcriptional regulator [Gracilibacteraceae bacterium]